MRYKIYKGDELINTIIADEAFAKAYCAENGYIYSEEPEPEKEAEPTEIEQLRADVDFIFAMEGWS